jgi:hypothetical protein
MVSLKKRNADVADCRSWMDEEIENMQGELINLDGI